MAFKIKFSGLMRLLISGGLYLGVIKQVPLIQVEGCTVVINPHPPLQLTFILAFHEGHILRDRCPGVLESLHDGVLGGPGRHVESVQGLLGVLEAVFGLLVGRGEALVSTGREVHEVRLPVRHLNGVCSLHARVFEQLLLLRDPSIKETLIIKTDVDAGNLFKTTVIV